MSGCDLLFDREYTCSITQDFNQCREEVCPGPSCPPGVQSFKDWVCPEDCNTYELIEFSIKAEDGGDAKDQCEETKIDKENEERCHLQCACWKG